MLFFFFLIQGAHQYFRPARGYFLRLLHRKECASKQECVTAAELGARSLLYGKSLVLVQLSFFALLFYSFRGVQVSDWCLCEELSLPFSIFFFSSHTMCRQSRAALELIVSPLLPVGREVVPQMCMKTKDCSNTLKKLVLHF